MEQAPTNNAGQLREILGGFLPEAQVAHVIRAWADCQAAESHCSVRRFVEKMAEELHLDNQVASQLTVKLFGAVLGQPPGGGQQPAPFAAVTSPVAAAIAQPASPVTRRGDAATKVFDGLVQELDRLAKALTGEHWSSFCAELAKHLNSLPALLPKRSDLLAGDIEPAVLAHDLDKAEDRQSFIHVYYLSMCNTRGPTQADRVLSDAVKLIEQLPVAYRYSPRQLL